MQGQTDVLLSRLRNRLRGIDPYSTVKNTGNVRELNINTKNSILDDEIFLNENGEPLESVEMVNFHGEGKLEDPRYYRKSTFNQLERTAHGFRMNPFTKQEILPENVVKYTAKPKSRKGGKRRGRVIRRRKQTTRKTH